MGFVNRNLVAIVMVPSIIGMHFGWSELQNNKQLVPEGTKIEQPIFSIVKRSWAYALNGFASSPESAQTKTTDEK